MTTLTGQTFFIEFDGVEITGPYRSFTPGVMDETAEGSAARSALRNYVTTLTKVEPKGKFIVNSTDTAILAKLKRGTSGTLTWGEQGNGTGMPKASITALVTKAEIVGEYDKEKEIEVEWVNTADDWVDDPASATFT